jgi:hypothetical protein
MLQNNQKTQRQTNQRNIFLAVAVSSFSLVLTFGMILSTQVEQTSKSASASYYCDSGTTSGSNCLIPRPQKQTYRCNGNDTLSADNKCTIAGYTYHANESYTTKCPSGFSENAGQCTKPAVKGCPNGGALQGDMCVD